MSDPAQGAGRFSRRVLLGGLGLAGAVSVLGACSDAAPAPPAPTTGPPSGAAPSTTTAAPNTTWSGDAQLVAVCAAFSALAAGLYTDAGTAAGQGRVGAVPGAVAAFLSAAAAQHTEYAAAWNQVLTTAGRPSADSAELRGAAQLRERLTAARAPVDLLALAADLEATAGATATAALGELTESSAVVTTAGAAPVAAMRAATAGFLLGRPPAVPGDPTAGALGRDALVG